ncbi:MAG: toll/interleukin-1 receptor domain-containing protein [Thaumarchaeota archaeon]|nr:toll/interleukin-1 receptor domain-containing protein [Nitrososphaerota archaeon]
MIRRIFIGYAGGDEVNARQLAEAVSRLGNTEVFIPNILDTHDRNLAKKIRNGIESSHLIILLITFNSTNTIWLNQEIGYAAAKNIPTIPIVEKGIDLKGFLEGMQFIVFQRGDFKNDIYQTISRTRRVFSKLETPITQFQATCPGCKIQLFLSIPSQNVIEKMIERKERIQHRCNSCATIFYIDPETLESQA